MKKIVIISSTPRINGNSEILCNQFMLGAKENGNQVELIKLRDKKVNYCKGCQVCSNFGYPCPQSDDAQKIMDKMLRADVIVLATPVYFYTMCAQLKTLIDRCCSCWTKISNKDFYYIVTAADENIDAMQKTIDGFRGFVDDCLEDCNEAGIVYGVGAVNVGDIKNTPSFVEAYNMGNKIK